MLAIGVAILGLGLKNVLLALIVLAVPPIITNCYVGIDQVDRDVVDAARGMGMTGWQILRRVELPLAVPLVMAGIRTAALFVVSTTTISCADRLCGQPRRDRQRRGQLSPLWRARRRDLYRGVGAADRSVAGAGPAGVDAGGAAAVVGRDA